MQLPNTQQRATIVRLLMFIILLLASSTVHAASDTTLARQHEEAVLLARRGQTQEAIQILMRLHHQRPNDEKITNDLIVISGWDGQFSQAEKIFVKKSPMTYPVYVQYAMVNTYRNLKQPTQGLQLIDGLLQQYPGNDQWLLRKALLLIDNGQLEQANGILQQVVQRIGKDKEFHLASAYLNETWGNWLPALQDYQNALALLPGDKELLKKQMLALNHLRAPAMALTENQRNPQVLEKKEVAQLLANRAAQLLRWSTEANKNHKEARLFSLKALSLQLQALALLTDTPGSQQARRLIRQDMIISLRNLRQMENLQTLYNHLLESGEVPDYVRQAFADSLLVSRRPEESRKIYQQLVEKNPKNYQAALGLFYAYVEEEDFDLAYETIDALADKEPKYRRFWDSKSNYPNERYLDLQVTSIQARFYGDQLEEAWNRIDTLSQHAPKNNWLLEVRGQISNARSWHRQALNDYHLATLLSPESLDAQAGKAASLIELRRYAEARPLLRNLQETDPWEHKTMELARQWKFARMPEYYGDIVFSNSSGPELDGDGILATAEIISAPINDVWKLSAGYLYAWSEILEGEETLQRTSLGLEYHKANWDVLGYLNYNDSTVQEPGGKLKAIWQPDDFWQLTLSGERFAVTTPLRALYHGIRADAVSTSAMYRSSEMRDISGAIQASTFTDDNNRIEGSARFRQRFIDIPHIDIDGRLDLYASTNSKTNVPYYSPENDFSLKGSIHVDHVYHRDYDHLLAHQLDVGYGFYDQEGYSSRWIGHIRYEHRYRFSPWLEMLAGVEFGQNVYDGHAEPYRLARFMINGIF